jgi:hypothetical protein
MFQFETFDLMRLYFFKGFYLYSENIFLLLCFSPHTHSPLCAFLWMNAVKVMCIASFPYSISISLSFFFFFSLLQKSFSFSFMACNENSLSLSISHSFSFSLSLHPLSHSISWLLSFSILVGGG